MRSVQIHSNCLKRSDLLTRGESGGGRHYLKLSDPRRKSSASVTRRVTNRGAICPARRQAALVGSRAGADPSTVLLISAILYQGTSELLPMQRLRLEARRKNYWPGHERESQ